MLSIEELLIEKVLCNNKTEALKYYDQFFNHINCCCCNGYQNLRNIKNHLIVLNSILYQAISSSSSYKEYIYENRNQINKEIERQNQVNKLYQLGEEIILFYLSNHDKKSIQANNPIINRAINYIDNNLDKELTLETVSKAINVSSNYLSALFQKLVGSSFCDYINKSRIEKSKILLKNPSLSILDIAIECGFSSQSYFCYVFKKFENMTPREYRRKVFQKK